MSTTAVTPRRGASTRPRPDLDLRSDATARDEPAAAGPRPAGLRAAYRAVRSHTERLAAPLSAEDQVIQSMPDASPTKWHRAHTTWFFEQFLLEPHAPGYRRFDDRFPFLFNSYYVAAGPRHARPRRGMVTRPDVATVGAYRVHVDAAVDALLADEAALPREIATIVEIGLNHEQQHQELLLTDILHAFSENPCLPAYDPDWRWCAAARAPGTVMIPEGIHTVGHQGGGFAYDNESPAHRVLVGPVAIARGLVTNDDWLAFMRDGGYDNAALWLSDGFAAVQAEGWRAPGHWREQDGGWHVMTLGGLVPVDRAAPVCHVSYYEAEAFARWSGRHLPSEFEWEVAARSGELADAFGVVWQWTRSAYAPYPAYRAADGALGEYNGKFMVNQMVLRGSSLATPPGHARATYRNFFPPSARWQFTGVRLASFPA
ncbi:sulfatase maturase [Rhodoplanes elegans]|uniref:ergothioneine biosynthesis protein EgtB n=2 Tax=Rhodoplanes elegans TaxID=29408 RepID=UPI001912A683|nr:ergothioneine biosynthesis protein EgtB [Rhodoplanes elegans]MBK5958719.1 sulfatase maturase [Rhodoplanes elegans]